MRRLIMALGAVSVLACGDSTGPIASAEGTWNLETIDGEGLPITVFQFGTYTAELMSVRVIAASNGTFTSTSTTRETDNGTVTTTTESATGTWTQTNAAVTVTNPDDGTSVTGAISGDTLTFTEDGIVLVYRRD